MPILKDKHLQFGYISLVFCFCFFGWGGGGGAGGGKGVMVGVAKLSKIPEQTRSGQSLCSTIFCFKPAMPMTFLETTFLGQTWLRLLYKTPEEKDI